mmetsp:Transcript_11333/g.43760  ORF Transcript_11333/g.43760 Transcript_11333/m.43760 type:complete len:200 (-) Transcript_11333:1382-1981(-)
MASPVEAPRVAGLPEPVAAVARAPASALPAASVALRAGRRSEDGACAGRTMGVPAPALGPPCAPPGLLLLSLVLAWAIGWGLGEPRTKRPALRVSRKSRLLEAGEAALCFFPGWSCRLCDPAEPVLPMDCDRGRPWGVRLSADPEYIPLNLSGWEESKEAGATAECLTLAGTFLDRVCVAAAGEALIADADPGAEPRPP